MLEIYLSLNFFIGLFQFLDLHLKVVFLLLEVFHFCLAIVQNVNSFGELIDSKLTLVLELLELFCGLVQLHLVRLSFLYFFCKVLLQVIYDFFLALDSLHIFLELLVVYCFVLLDGKLIVCLLLLCQFPFLLLVEEPLLLLF